MLRNLFIGGVFWLLPYMLTAQDFLKNEREVQPAADIFPLTTTDLPMNGAITGYHADGSLHYEGRTRKSKLHGNWKRWYPSDNILEEGRLVKGIPDGEWKVWYPDGQLRFIRTYSYSKNERIRQEMRRPNPRSVLYPITQNYLKDRNGTLSQMNTDPAFSLLNAENIPPVFNQWLLHGAYISYRDNGSLQDLGFYKNGLKEGVWIESESENSYHTGAYHNGQKTGTWKLFDSNKRLLEMEEYRNGKRIWGKRF